MGDSPSDQPPSGRLFLPPIPCEFFTRIKNGIYCTHEKGCFDYVPRRFHYACAFYGFPQYLGYNNLAGCWGTHHRTGYCGATR